VQLDSFARVALKNASTVVLGWMAGFSCAGKLEQAIVATMIPRRSELRFISARSVAFQSD